MSNIEEITTNISGFFESIWNILTYPSQKLDDAADSILELILEYNLDPIYTCTVCMNLILLSYWGKFRKWRRLSTNEKHFAYIQLIGTAIFNFVSLLKLLGLIDI